MTALVLNRVKAHQEQRGKPTAGVAGGPGRPLEACCRNGHPARCRSLYLGAQEDHSVNDQDLLAPRPAPKGADMALRV